MWHLATTEKWIDEVIRVMNERQLKPENSRFMIAFFTSMDNDFVSYFRNNKDRISSFSGRNFHILTPLIYESDTIPDDEWRHMRDEFKHSGVPLTNDPTFVFFSLEGGGVPNVNGWTTFSYYPEFFAGFSCNSFTNFPNKLKNAIEACIEMKHTHLLTQKLSEIFASPNIIWHEHGGELGNIISRKLPKSTLFISHSSIDKPFIKKLEDELIKDNSIKLWIDEKEILAGDNIQETITGALQSKSDFFLLIISENSIKSSWVQFEVSQFIGFAQGKNIIPIIISKEQSFPEPINNLIKRLKHIDFTDRNKWNENIEELKRAISRN